MTTGTARCQRVECRRTRHSLADHRAADAIRGVVRGRIWDPGSKRWYKDGFAPFQLLESGSQNFWTAPNQPLDMVDGYAYVLTLRVSRPNDATRADKCSECGDIDGMKSISSHALEVHGISYGSLRGEE